MTKNNIKIDNSITDDDLIEKLRAIVRKLNTDIYTYEHLFTNQNIVNNMNELAPAFFENYQELLTEKICLTIASLFDRAKDNYGNESISFRLFVERLDHSDLKCTLNQKISAITQKIEAIKTLRNKYIAHNDAEFTLKITDTYEGISLNLLKESINEIKTLLQECHGVNIHVKITANVYPAKQLENLLRIKQPNLLNNT